MAVDAKHTNPRSVRVELKVLLREAKLLHRDLIIVFLSVAILGIVSYYFGSRRFFRQTYYGVLSGDELYMLYEYLYWFVGEFTVSFIVPLLIIVTLIRRPLKEFGLGFGDWHFGLKMSVIFIVIMLPILWIVSDLSSFRVMYPHAQLVRDNWKLFIIYEFFFFMYFIGWEFIWRGFTLFGLEKHVGGGIAVLIQMVPFVILHNGKPLLETVGAIVAAIALGVLTLRTRSFWYCVIIHWSVMFSIDLLSTVRYRYSITGISLSSVNQFLSIAF